MKRMSVLIILPLMLFGLEKVNLVKNGGFECNNDVWKTISTIDGTGSWDSTIYKLHDPDSVYGGKYSGSIDGRKKPTANPPFLYGILGSFLQTYSPPKRLEDLDSMEVFHMFLSPEDQSGGLTFNYQVMLKFYNPTSTNYVEVIYTWISLGLGQPTETPNRKFFIDTMKTEGIWIQCSRNLITDLINVKDLPANLQLDSLFLSEYSFNDNGVWRSQKVFFDDIRLTGYADYDVGIKSVLSGDSVWKNTGYTPTARIKNFGRKPADSFLVIAEIEGGAGVIYADTLSWSLSADTEDTVSFKEFKPSDAANYTLTVSTFMTPDESDEDDAVSRTLFGTAVAEPLLSPQSLSLQIEGVLRAGLSSIRYSLPLGEQGTISLYDPAGRRIESMKITGSGSVSLKSGLSSGVYFVKLEMGEMSVTRKAIVLS